LSDKKLRRVYADESPRRSPRLPLKVYWKMCGTNDVHSSYVSHRRNGLVFLTSGHHLRESTCYYTPQHASTHQCDCVGCKAYRLEEEHRFAESDDDWVEVTRTDEMALHVPRWVLQKALEAKGAK
jgi:hypothetical protein